MGRWLTVPFLFALLVAALAATGLGALHLRARQALLDQELSQAWQDLATDLAAASTLLGEPPDPALEPERLGSVVSDTALQNRLGRRGDRLDSLCRSRTGRKESGADLDSLREAVRRGRERVGLAVANYRGERRSFPGAWVLQGFPER